MGEKILVELAERYRIHNRAENKSPKTLEWHETAVKRFCQFVESWKGSEATLSDLNPDNVKLFIVHLQETPTSHNHPFIAYPTKRVSDSTINSYVRSLRAFSRFLHQDGKTKVWILEKVKPPRTELKLKNLLTLEEIKAIFSEFNPQCFLGSRNQAMLGLLLDGGPRVSELLCLRREDLNTDVGFVKVKGKGRKERLVGVSDEALLLISSYLEYRPDTDCPNLFVTFEGKRLSYNAIQMIFVRLKKKLGLKYLHPHLLRHCSATFHLQNGEDPVSLQRQLGHSSIAVTQQYIGLVPFAQIKAHRETSPLKHLRLAGLKLKFLKQLDREISDKELHLILDNYGTHKQDKVQKWLKRHKRFHLHFTPTGASWMNMVEIWFGILTNQAIRRGSFDSVAQLIGAIKAFLARWNEEAKPFVWTKTAEQILAKTVR